MVTVQFTDPFKRRLKQLAKRYRSIKTDLQPVLQQLQAGDFIGDQITGLNATAFKARIRNSDIPTGKSGGYRLIYQILSPSSIALLVIYAKSEQVDINADEIKALLIKSSG
ncbi:MAG: type II toxin-antitoxin system RelE/ParE family toxin [Spirulina sp. SIO3F2]|nr:type II toxin-antitoxin system RelE/ParE family toxin [Spirulina sp. SIO3F2]